MTTQTIIQNARQHLGFIKDALEDLKTHPSSPKVKQKSLANILVWGRSVTFVLQNLRSTVGKERFDTWYNPVQEEMKCDELLIAFKDARNVLEKQGSLRTHTSMVLNNFSGSMLRKYMENPPPNAKSFFVGDTIGGSGWEIELPDGTTEKLYVDIDLGENMDLKVHFSHPSTNHKGANIADTSIEHCSLLYYDYLKNLVDKASAEFLR